MVPTYHLNSGHTKSCGCYLSDNRSQNSKKNKTHGMTKTRLYVVWRGMKRRCYYPRESSFPHYGGRGITVCDEWNNSFEAFRDWAMANGYRDDLTLDRIDYNGNYEPSNCKWSTMEEQQNNKSNNIILTYNGQTHTAPEWSRITGIPVIAIYNRVKYRWSTERILTEPIRTYTRRNNRNGSSK